MTSPLIQISQHLKHFLVSRWGALGLVTLTLLGSSTALGSHLEEHSVFGIHKPDRGLWHGQDPTLQQFLAPQNAPDPQPKTAENPESRLTPIPSISPVQHEVMAVQGPAPPPMQQGWKFLLNGQSDAAMSAYRQALSRQPDSANALLGMGMTFKAMGKTEEAKEAITHALALNPQMASALVHLGYLYADGPSDAHNSDTAQHLFLQAQQMGDPFARIALLDLQARTAL